MKCKLVAIAKLLVVASIVIAGSVALGLSDVPDVDEWPPAGEGEFTAARGEDAAHRDLQNNVRQVVLYGLLNGSAEATINSLRGFGYMWRSGGCSVGDEKYYYTQAYNRVMIEAGRKQFGEQFAEAMKGTI